MLVLEVHLRETGTATLLATVDDTSDRPEECGDHDAGRQPDVEDTKIRNV